jgi:hypothetical protein
MDMPLPFAALSDPLLDRATELRTMALTARTQPVADALNRLAERFEVLATERRQNEHRPGARAPVAGHYHELNLFGAPTGKVHRAQGGDPLPGAPRGFTWRLIGADLPPQARPFSR